MSVRVTLATLETKRVYEELDSALQDKPNALETQTRHTATSAVGLFCLTLWSPTYHTFAYDLGSLRQVGAGPVDVLSGFLSGPNPGVHGVLSLRECSTKVIGKIFAEISASECIMLNDHMGQILGISIFDPNSGGRASQ